MANIASLPDEIVQCLLQSIRNTGDEDLAIREAAFLNLVIVLPQWIPILLDARFVNDAGQLGPRFEDVWGYRQRVYLDEQSRMWKVRDQQWQPHGAKVNGWKCRNGDSSHVELKEEEEDMKPAKQRRGGRRKANARSRDTQQPDNPLTAYYSPSRE